jgi:hypothetical protein
MLVLLMLLLLPLGMDAFTPTEVTESMRMKREVKCGQSRSNPVERRVVTRTSDAEKREDFVVGVVVVALPVSSGQVIPELSSIAVIRTFFSF